jgi:hypothetical protein
LPTISGWLPIATATEFRALKLLSTPETIDSCEVLANTDRSRRVRQQDSVGKGLPIYELAMRDGCRGCGLRKTKKPGGCQAFS